MPSTHTQGYAFLEDLGPSIKRYPYKGWQQFLDIWNAERRRQQIHPKEVSEWMLLSDVNRHTFIQGFSDLDQLPTWTSYDASLNLLLVKLPNTRPRECAAATFQDIVHHALEPTGLVWALDNNGRSVYNSVSRSKQADIAWVPVRLPKGRSKAWPAVVLEVAYSETQSKLDSDVRFWLHESEEDVRIVITIAVDQQEPRITIERWGLENDRPHRIQNVTIAKGANQQIAVSNAPLVIEFENLFLRPATTPKEKDIELDAEILKILADKVWRAQEFYSL